MNPVRVPRGVFFDFDGVVLESADIKTEAFRKLFRRWPDREGAVMAYHLKNAGISRFVKFRFIFRRILKAPLSPQKEKELGRRFSALIEHRLWRCRAVPGVRPLLRRLSKKTKLFVVSGTPQGELRRWVQRRGLADFFKSVRGSPPAKIILLREMLRRWSLKASACLLVGDALTDWRAARACRMPFVGRVPPGASSVFPRGTPVVRDGYELAAWLQRRYRL